jgi:hypothetical protein
MALQSFREYMVSEKVVNSPKRPVFRISLQLLITVCISQSHCGNIALFSLLHQRCTGTSNGRFHHILKVWYHFKLLYPSFTYYGDQVQSSKETIQCSAICWLSYGVLLVVALLSSFRIPHVHNRRPQRLRAFQVAWSIHGIVRRGAGITISGCFVVSNAHNLLNLHTSPGRCIVLLNNHMQRINLSMTLGCRRSRFLRNYIMQSFEAVAEGRRLLAASCHIARGDIVLQIAPHLPELLLIHTVSELS